METFLRYTGIDANKFKNPEGPVNINNNSSISGVEKKGEGLIVEFSFTSKYEPDVGEIKLKGEVAVKGEKEKIDAAYTQWVESEKKHLPKDIAERIHNLILFNSITESVIIARELQLPSPIPMPRVNIADKQDTSYIG